jgi:alkylated DNA repair dioxygenase AlkB
MPEPELLLVWGFVPEHEELYRQLVTGIAWDERMRARKTANFGAAYNYSGMTYGTVPMHPLLVPVVDRLERKLGFRPSNCLVNYYSDGEATMGFHSDSEEEIVPGTGVAIVSLGAERSITYRSKEDRQVEHSYPLPAGSLLYMPPEVQREWKHGVLKQDGVGGRISLTFRLLLPAVSDGADSR